MNKVGVKLLKWVKSKKYDKEEWVSQEYCKEMWRMYGEKAIDKAMKQKSCTTLGEFRKLASFYSKPAKPKKLFTDNPYYKQDNT